MRASGAWRRQVGTRDGVAAARAGMRHRHRHVKREQRLRRGRWPAASRRPPRRVAATARTAGRPSARPARRPGGETLDHRVSPARYLFFFFLSSSLARRIAAIGSSGASSFGFSSSGRPAPEAAPGGRVGVVRELLVDLLLQQVDVAAARWLGVARHDAGEGDDEAHHDDLDDHEGHRAPVDLARGHRSPLPVTRSL